MSNDPPAAEREHTTKNLHVLVTPSTREAFEAWCVSRGMTLSGGVRALVEDALYREASDEPLGALYGGLTTAKAHQIVIKLRARETPTEA